MSSIDTDQIRKRLVEERERLASSAAFLERENAGSLEDELGEVSEPGADNHLGDTATATYDRELDEGLEEGVQQAIADVDDALRKLEDGTFGTCEICGREIAPERLEAMPWARLCIDDARKQGA